MNYKRTNAIVIMAMTFFIHKSMMGAVAPTHSQEASIRTGNTLCQEEQNYIAQRVIAVKASLEQALGMTLQSNEIPRIALCASGGGYRAMISTLGSLQGFTTTPTTSPTKNLHTLLESALAFFDYTPPASTTQSPVPSSLGLLDICTYISSISGSAWALAGLIQSNKSIEDYLAYLSTTLPSGLLKEINIPSLAQALIKKHASGLPVSLIDLWGGLIAEKILMNKQNPALVSDQATMLDATRLPLPLYAAITGNDGMPYSWIEFNPYEVGSPALNAYIPLWAFGRKFNQGVSQESQAPQLLSYALGIWGSAISVDIKEFYEYEIAPLTNSIVTYALQEFLTVENNAQLNSVLDHRVSPAQVFNWTSNAPTPAFLTTVENLILVDGGIDFNIPIPSLLTRGRTVDIILILDASSGPLGGELRKAEQYAADNNLAFPAIDYATINQTCSVHYHEQDLNIPVVIYMPLIADATYLNGWNPWEQAFTATTNFDYTSAQITLLSGLTQNTMRMNQKKILDAIRQRIIASRTTYHTGNS